MQIFGGLVLFLETYNSTSTKKNALHHGLM